MTDIEQKALALVNEIFAEVGGSPIDYDALVGAGDVVTLALCRAIEQHEAFRQEVSDVVKKYFSMDWNTHNMVSDLHRFIIIAKPDPLVEAFDAVWPGIDRTMVKAIRAALEARGLEIRGINT